MAYWARAPPPPARMYCGVHYLWFAFVCFFIRSPPPPPPVRIRCWCPRPPPKRDFPSRALLPGPGGRVVRAVACAPAY